jgi:hypothetical protein
MKYVNEQNVRQCIKEARKDFFPSSGPVRVSKSFIEAIDRDVNKLVRKMVKRAGPGTKTLNENLFHIMKGGE